MLRASSRVFVLCACVVSAGCGGGGSNSSTPTSPTPPAAAAPAPTPPAPTAAVSVTYSPSPVPWSAGPGTILPACANIANVWRFTTTFRETGGVAVTVTSVVATVDGVAQASVAVGVPVPANGSTAQPSEVCFGTSTQHTMQHNFTATDGQGRTTTFSGAQLVFSAR